LNVLTLLSETATGIEVTASSIRFVQLRKGFGKIEITNFGEKQIPVESIEYSSSKDKVILETVKSLFSDKKIRFKNIAVSIPRSSTYFRCLTLPPVKDDVIVPMVGNMAERHLPVRPTQAVYDFDCYEPDRKGMRDVILMGARRDDVTETVNLFKKSGIRLVSLEPSTLSSCRLIDEVTEGGDGEIIHIFIGEQEVHFNLFRGGRLLSSRVFDLCMEDLERDTSEYVKKLCSGILSSSRSHDMIPGQDTLTGKILLTCPENVAEVLQNSLGQVLGAEVIASSLPPWLENNPGLDIAKYGVPIGLAAGLFRSSTLSINLLPQETKEKRRRDEIIKTWILTGVNIILLLLLFTTLSLKRGKELTALKSEIKALEPSVRAAERVKGEPVLLAGMASSAANLIPILEESPMLENVRFEAPTTTTNVSGKQVENFRITATLIQGEDESEADTER
jgi:Tfp pilus assembly PilM family ATPase